MKTNLKSSIEKTPVFKPNSDIACWASENNAENCKRGPFEIF